MRDDANCRRVRPGRQRADLFYPLLQVDRLSSFDAAIEQAQALSTAGPAHIATAGDPSVIDFEDVNLFLPDGRQTVKTKHLALARGECVVLSGPSGSGKSTLFRAI